jgi:hypothetical protein
MTILGLAILAIWMTHSLVEDAARPSGLRDPHYDYLYVYPTASVTWWVSTIAVEFVIASCVLWWVRRLAVASTVLTVAFLLGTVSTAVGFDGPMYPGDHNIFLALATLWMFLVFLASWSVHGARHIAEHRRRRRRGDSPPRTDLRDADTAIPDEHRPMQRRELALDRG